MGALADNGAFWIVLIALAAVLYLLPTLVGLIRGVDGLALVFLVNLIGGTALIGWPAAMILAFGPRRLPRDQSQGSYPFVVRDPERFWVPRTPNSR
jgi:fucose permease